MEFRELRYGNLVNDSIGIVEIGKNADIKFAEIYQPIPLTEKWLLKFGFEKYESEHDKLKSLELSVFKCFLLYSDEQDNFQDVSLMYVDETRDYDSYGVFNKFEYVHQLQNLYFALTGEELAIKHGEGATV